MSGSTNSGSRTNRRIVRNTVAVNYLSLCAITLPVGLDKAGMPVGLQLIAPPWAEEKLRAIALAAERLLGNATERLGTPPVLSCSDRSYDAGCSSGKSAKFRPEKGPSVLRENGCGRNHLPLLSAAPHKARTSGTSPDWLPRWFEIVRALEASRQRRREHDRGGLGTTRFAVRRPGRNASKGADRSG